MSQIYVVSGFEIGDVSPDRLSHSAPCSNGKTASKKYVLTKKKYTPTLIKNLQRYEMINKWSFKTEALLLKSRRVIWIIMSNVYNADGIEQDPEIIRGSRELKSGDKDFFFFFLLLPLLLLLLLLLLFFLLLLYDLLIVSQDLHKYLSSYCSSHILPINVSRYLVPCFSDPKHFSILCNRHDPLLTPRIRFLLF